MGIRNLARIHEKEIIGKPKSVFDSVFRVRSARALFCLRESNFVRGLSFYWTSVLKVVYLQFRSRHYKLFGRWSNDW